jgi:hypothetical protein
VHRKEGHVAHRLQPNRDYRRETMNTGNNGEYKPALGYVTPIS